MQVPLKNANANFPQPSPDAKAHSDILKQHIRDEITASAGWISFARYMELVLYAPGLGYYSAGAKKIGKDGDFITAPEISVLYGQTLARCAADVLRETNGDILELGAGSGKLALDMLGELERMQQLPRHYFILEVSADLRQRQQALLSTASPAIAACVQWLDALPSTFDGFVIGNEVLDAIPVHLVAWKADDICERGVTIENGEFIFRDRPIDKNAELYVTAKQLNLPAGYVSEINLSSRGFINSLAQILNRGTILLVDYGFAAAEFYHPHRSAGTLMCHYRHYAHTDPFYLPGLQDVTSHVDFSAIADAGQAAGLELLGYATQAQFLLGCGITDLIARHDANDVKNYLPLVNQAQRLLSPAEMGELFKVMGLGKKMPTRLKGFDSGRLRL